MRTNARLPAVLVLAAVLAGGAPWGLLLRLAVPVLVVGAAAEQECVADGTCKSTTTSSSTSSSSTSSTSSTSSSSSVWPADQPYCALYLAESTIPGAGMGIFTVEEKVRGDTISRGDLCIPFIDMYWHNDDPIPINPFRDYFWMGTSMGMQQESDSDDIEAYCPGLDCAVNTHPALNNLEKMTPIYDDGGLHRSKDPGAGAITPYHNGSTYVNRDIPAGGELFKDYGSSWFNYRWEAFQYLPMWEHYEEAHALLRKWDTLKVRDDTVKADLYSILKGLDVAPRNAEAALHADESSFHSRILAALPSTYRDAKHVLDHDTDIPSLHQDKHVRSIEYLRNHGKCLDHIQNRPSTIPQAGRGAFAVRDLPKGTIISASPLHHVEESFANMYNFSVRPDGSWLRVKDQVVNKQLMLNYCFAHPNSTILLCPYGSSINYINHSRNQTNVRIQWATNFTYGHNHSMVEGPLSDLLKTEKPKLAFDYIATRDIKEGDELLLDYGDAWIAAWERHVQNWKPVANADSYTSARLMNLYFPDSILRTELEQQYDPYPPHLELRCHKGLFNAAGKTQFRWTINDVGMPCRVLARDIRKDDGQVLYSVELEYHHGKNKVTRTQRSDVPRHSMAFVDVPFSTDLHLRNAFRHPIGIPDDIFPPQWTNKLLEESDAAAQPGPPGDRATVVDSNTLKDSLLGDNAENDDDYEDDDFSYYN